ncbi:hypothetical protein RU86_GL001038 [Lactococcus piscium]|uniref:Uncharacterized protein n=2 Tax=Pseudolactococcus piscium TaxID=1364 RepID=A0A2A5S5B3_9LACT|nr:hypothetical protein RU86_GL001038 [Lactococcus piscium]
MENRTYFKFMTVLDQQIGFAEADVTEYSKMEKEYKATVEDNEAIKLVDDCKQNNIIYLHTHTKTNNELDKLFK